MYKNQLFKIIPSKSFVENILQLYGINGFDEHYYFTRNDLENKNIIQSISNCNKLKDYYINCKAKKYLTNLTVKKCITILRQILRPYNYKIISIEKYKNGVKYLLYKLKNLSKNSSILNEGLTIKFD